ncbi:hypothetical protein [Paenibacillus sp. 8b26]|uniref:hypothetical protein n=1 Tax=Paenibacillus sp. 8b26 TaxID=3424133 RepID=UPI003D658589
MKRYCKHKPILRSGHKPQALSCLRNHVYYPENNCYPQANGCSLGSYAATLYLYRVAMLLIFLDRTAMLLMLIFFKLEGGTGNEEQRNDAGYRR